MGGGGEEEEEEEEEDEKEKEVWKMGIRRRWKKKTITNQA
jgi:hypothetical protein